MDRSLMSVTMLKAIAHANPHLSVIMYFLHPSYVQIFPLCKILFPNNSFSLKIKNDNAEANKQLTKYRMKSEVKVLTLVTQTILFSFQYESCLDLMQKFHGRKTRVF